MARTLEEAAPRCFCRGAVLMEGPDAPACVWPQVNRRSLLGWASLLRAALAQALVRVGSTGQQGAVEPWPGGGQHGPRVGVSARGRSAGCSRPGAPRGEAAAV